MKKYFIFFIITSLVGIYGCAPDFLGPVIGPDAWRYLFWLIIICSIFLAYQLGKRTVTKSKENNEVILKKLEELETEIQKIKKYLITKE